MAEDGRRLTVKLLLSKIRVGETGEKRRTEEGEGEGKGREGKGEKGGRSWWGQVTATCRSLPPSSGSKDVAGDGIFLPCPYGPGR
ncbi:hypothetical protein ACJRO7_033251, partial [Eucalyptus globulus]